MENLVHCVVSPNYSDIPEGEKRAQLLEGALAQPGRQGRKAPGARHSEWDLENPQVSLLGRLTAMPFHRELSKPRMGWP